MLAQGALSCSSLVWRAANDRYRADCEDLRTPTPQDLPLVVARGQTGATTVSATMLLAHRAGIRVFVTGGIGGVHRGGLFSWDVSADLTELGRTPVAVVCAGVKSILDIPRTLEYLETQGVMVATLGSDVFPAFYTRDSGVASPARVDSPEEARGAATGGLF